MSEISFAETFEEINNLSRHMGTRNVRLSKLYADFFKELICHFDEILPEIFSVFIKKFPDSARCVQEMQSLINDAISLVDIPTIKHFFCKHSAILAPIDQMTPSVLVYLQDKNFYDHLDKASSSDIESLISSILESLKSLKIPIKESKSTDTDFVKEKLRDYNWIKQLSTYQTGITKMMETSKSLSIADLNEIGLTFLAESFTLIDQKQVIDLIQYHGMIRWQKSSKIVTVSCASLSLSDMLAVLPMTECDEIHFLCTECFYIDTSVSSCEWASSAAVNVAVCAPTVHVKGSCIIDVSGQNAIASKCSRKAGDGVPVNGFGSGDAGRHGMHGEAGQSGGNILIRTDQIVNHQLLTLHSSGGNGNDGQDGGDGTDGIAELGQEDDLTGWPHNIANFFYGSKARAAHVEIRQKMKELDENFKEELVEGTLHYWDSLSIYCETPKGVKLLFGFTDGACKRHAFLLSKSKDGISANGGDAGKGGSGGGGGKPGEIQLENIFGQDTSMEYPKIHQQRFCGKNGNPGKTGKQGKKSIAKRFTDHLQVDGWTIFGTQKFFPGVDSKDSLLFIEIMSWDRRSETRQELGNKAYYCHHELAAMIDQSSTIDSDEIGFFNTERTKACLSKNNTKAKDGSDEAQSMDVTHTTRNKAINKAAMRSNFLQMENKYLTFLGLSRIFNKMRKSVIALDEQIEKRQNSVFEKHQQKKVYGAPQSNYSPSNCIPYEVEFQTMIHTDDGPIHTCERFIKKLKDDTTSLSQNSRLRSETLQPLLDCFALAKPSLHDVYSEILDIVMHVCQTEDVLSTKQETTIIMLLNNILLPILSQLPIENESDVLKLITLNNVLEANFIQHTSDVEPLMKKICSETMLECKYKWLSLFDFHHKLLDLNPPCSPFYQSRAVALYSKISKKKNFFTHEDIDIRSIKFKCFTKRMTTFSTTCTKAIFIKRTQSLIEGLMLHFNDVNSDNDKNVGLVFFQMYYQLWRKNL